MPEQKAPTFDRHTINGVLTQLTYAFRLNKPRFAELLFEGPLDDPYLISKWDQFNNDFFRFLWNLDKDRMDILLNYIKEQRGA